MRGHGDSIWRTAVPAARGAAVALRWPATMALPWGKGTPMSPSMPRLDLHWGSGCAKHRTAAQVHNSQPIADLRPPSSNAPPRLFAGVLPLTRSLALELYAQEETDDKPDI